MGVREQLVGTWRLVSFEYFLPDGSTLLTYGPNPVGLLVYDAAGNMTAQVMNPHRLRFASGDRRRGTLEEYVRALDGYVSYFGTYDVDEEGGYVTHVEAGDVFPNAVGTRQRRYFTLQGDRLILTVPPFLIRGEQVTGRVVWERAG